MNILIFTTAFFPLVGGLEKQTLNLLDEFLKKGHLVQVIAFQKLPEGQKKVETVEKQVTVYYNPNLIKVFSLFNWCDVFYMPN
ncbi:MAG TPA: hypothetical protein VF623_15575, partial [Segetibacter sp.]